MPEHWVVIEMHNDTIKRVIGGFDSEEAAEEWSQLNEYGGDGTWHWIGEVELP